jgi:pimeloyl-ACP methyl ester carboxylesterase
MKRLACLLAVVVLLSGACTGDKARSERRAIAPLSTSSTSTTTSTSSTSSTTTTTPTTTTTTSPSTTTTAIRPAPSPGTLAWLKCGALQCATLAVPRNYADPAGPTISLALARRPAKSPANRIGSLVFNPGGPGNSGIDSLPGELRVLTPALQARFDIVSFDPRGIGRSAPVRCRSAEAASSSGGGGPAPDPAPETDEGRRALVEGFRAYAAACAEHNGDLLGQVGTDSTAEDLERIRGALGEERLTFIGHSAGTLLGAVYAERYPQRVRAFVLDGPLDPSLSLDQMTLAQAAGFEHSLSEFFTWCGATASCAWRPASEPRNAFLSLLDRVRRQPLPAPGHQVVGVGDLITGTMSRLTARSRWASLGDALAAAERNDGTPLATLASNYENHGASNAADARQAIICLDHPTPRDPAAYPSLAQAAATRAPVFGPVFLWSALSCGVWPVQATLAPRPVRAAGAPPILVVGTTGDPATPQAWAEALAGQLEQGVLVLRQGAEHVAYYYSSCIRGIVDAYLIDGRPPADGTVCAR